MAMADDVPLKLSIIIPVRNDAPSVNIMVRVLDALVSVANEIIVVYDDLSDTSIPVIAALQPRFPQLRGVHNDHGRGVLPALRRGFSAARGDYVMIFAADEIGPALVIDKMLALMDKGCDLVSATRYAGGGRRYGGSLLGHALSRLANILFGLCSATALSDCTTGIKMMRRGIFEQLGVEGIGAGWSCAFEIAIRAQRQGLKLAEVPIVSIDRLFGGQSTFQPIPWIIAYSRLFLWGTQALPPWFRPRPRLAFAREQRLS